MTHPLYQKIGFDIEKIIPLVREGSLSPLAIEACSLIVTHNPKKLKKSLIDQLIPNEINNFEVSQTD